MLNLLESVEVDGLVVFRDDEDIRKFYPLPDQPVIPRDDRGEPDFLFLRYINDLSETAPGEDDGAGFVQFRTALVMSPDRRTRLLDALRAQLVDEQANGRAPFGQPVTSTEPLLAAPVWTDGTVNLSTFAVSDTGLVRAATSNAPVDLTGDLGAMLAIQLDDSGTEVFWTAFDSRAEQHIPISVQFDLGYKARVSARMEIHAKHAVIHREILQWARPYRMMRFPYLRYVALPDITTFVGGAQLAALQATVAEPIRLCVPQQQVRDSISQTISTNTITVKIETDQASSGEDGAKVEAALLAIATDVLTERVIPAMFGGGTRPGAADESAPSATVTLLEVSEDPPAGDSSFDLVLDHAGTVERRIHPNGPVQVLLGSDEQMARCFRTLRLSDRALAATQIIASTAGVDFVDDGITAVHVFFSYEHTDEADPGKPVVKRQTDGLLTKPEDVVRWRFDLARTADGRHITDYLYKTDVLYSDGNQVEGVWRKGTGRSLLVTPAAMGAIKVDLVLTAPATLVESAEVELRYTPPDGPDGPTPQLRKTLSLTATDNRQSWMQFTGVVPEVAQAVAPPTYKYRVHYRVRGVEVVTDWQKTADPLLEIGTPFAKVLTYTLRPQGSFEGVASVSGDVVYTDERNGYTVTEPFELKTLAESHPVMIGVLPGGPETVTWRARLTRTDGSGANLGPGEAGAGTVWVGTDVDFLAIKVVPDLVDFAGDVQLALVELTYADPEHDINQTTTFTFSETAALTQEWKVARSDRTKNRYDAHIRYVAYDRTKSSEVQLDQIDDQVLLLERTA